MTESIDPGLRPPDSTGPFAAERLAALRQPSQKRRKPAQTSKIVAAGLSTTALFGMVAAMGWPSGTNTAQSAPLQTTTAPVAPVVAPTTTPATDATAVTFPTVPTTAAPVPTTPALVPTTAAPVPLTAALVVVPEATPVVQVPARKKSVRTASNTVTKSSG